MALGNCASEIQDCDFGQMTFEQIFRKLIRADGNCLSLKTDSDVTGSFTPSSTQRTVTRTSDAVVHSSSVTAGARSVIIETDSNFTGTILGVTADASRAYEFSVKQNDDTLGAIAYQITAGSIIITKIV